MASHFERGEPSPAPGPKLERIAQNCTGLSQLKVPTFKAGSQRQPPDRFPFCSLTRRGDLPKTTLDAAKRFGEDGSASGIAACERADFA